MPNKKSECPEEFKRRKERNKLVLEKFIAGVDHEEIKKEFNITPRQLAEIVIHKCKKLNLPRPTSKRIATKPKFEKKVPPNVKINLIGLYSDRDTKLHKMYSSLKGNKTVQCHI